MEIENNTEIIWEITPSEMENYTKIFEKGPIFDL